MWCWQSGIACAAAASAVVVASVFFPVEPALAESFRINNVDKAQRINMREQPSNRSKVVAYIPPDSTLEGTGNCDDRWCEVRFRDRVGWVFRKYLLPREPKAAEAVVTAPPVQAPEPSAAAQAEPEKDDIPADLQDTMLRLVFAGGRPIPVYAFPSDRLPAAGRLDPGTKTVEDLGTCSRNFCYIRSGSLVGWIPEDAIVRDKSGATRTEPPAKPEPSRAQAEAPAPPEPAATEAAATEDADPPRALDGTVPTATQPGQTTGLPIDGPGSIEIKTYSIAGLSSEASLPAREQPEDGAPIVGWIPGGATDIEGLRKCVQKYCLVRHEAVTGWVARRHLADENASASKRYLVSGVALWGALDVVDYPGQGAAIVGHIPAYASGVVPIGNCDKDWCHIRYLGIAGWVSGKYLAQQSR